MAQLTAGELQAASIMCRSCSIISLLGSVCIIITFSVSDAFHSKPINRLVFYASFGNMMTDVGMLMSRSYIDNPDSFGCQFQAMLIQLFMLADMAWILAMAINVYLTIYWNFDARHLRRVERIYLLACYGIPFVPAFILVFVRRDGKRVYGDAETWCSMSNDFKALRFASFYIPTWIMILLTFAIYVRVGGTVLRTYREVRQFKLSLSKPSANDGDDATASMRAKVRKLAESKTRSNSREPIIRQLPAYYGSLVTVSALAQEPAGAVGPLPAFNTTCEPSTAGRLALTRSQCTAMRHPTGRRSNEPKNAAWSYTKYAMLYFTAVLITWTPSTANRLYGLAHDQKVNAPLRLLTAFVAPLQGFWNWAIYSVISWSAYRDVWQDLKRRRLFASR